MEEVAESKEPFWASLRHGELGQGVTMFIFSSEIYEKNAQNADVSSPRLTVPRPADVLVERHG